jgi:hypothetical protein
MSELSWIGITIYFLSLAAIVLSAVVAAGQLRPSLQPRRELIKKISVGILVLCAGYWYLTVPYAGVYYDFSDKLRYPGSTVETDREQGKYLGDHHHRIEALERELKIQREEFRELREHYHLLLQLGLYAFIYYASFLIFSKRKNDQSSDIIKLDLNNE